MSFHACLTRTICEKIPKLKDTHISYELSGHNAKED